MQYLVTTKLNLVSCQNVLQNYKNADYALCTCSRIQRGQIIYEGAIYLEKNHTKVHLFLKQYLHDLELKQFWGTPQLTS